MTYERKSYLVGVAGLVVAIIALALSYQAIRASWQIAEISGSLEKSELEVSFGKSKLPTSAAIHIISGTKGLSNGSGPVIGGMPIRISSTGKKSLEAVTITFQYHPFFKRALLNEIDARPNGDVGPIVLQRSILENQDRTFMSYKIPILNPGTSVTVSEPFFMQSTTIADTLRATTKDGVPMTVPYEVRLSMQFAFTVGARDTAIRPYSVSLTVTQADSMQDLLKKEANRHVEFRRREIREKLTAFEYFAALVTSSPTGSAYVLFVPTEAMNVQDAEVHVVKGEAEAGTLEYQLLSWALLLGGAR